MFLDENCSKKKKPPSPHLQSLVTPLNNNPNFHNYQVENLESDSDFFASQTQLVALFP